MQFDPIEVGRLAIMQRDPRKHVQRRVEHLDLVDDYHYEVAVTQQLFVPFHLSKEAREPQSRDLLVPLGRFPKDHMPDLRVAGPDGSALPLLSRSDLGRLVQALFNNAWHPQFFENLDAAAVGEAEPLWELVRSTVLRIVTSSKEGAHLLIFRLKIFLRETVAQGSTSKDLRRFLRSLLGKADFWIELEDLAESRLLVAQLNAAPGQTYVVTVAYVERFGYRGYSKGAVRRFLAWLGVIGFPISRGVANDGHAASLWIIQSAPEGLEPVRCFWTDEGDRVDPEHRVSVDMTRAVVKGHDAGASGRGDLLFEVQVSPSSAIASTAALAALLFVVSTYAYQALPHIQLHASTEERAIFVALGSIFAATPAAIGGALAYRGQTFVRRASRGPRALLALLSAQAALFAVIVSLKGLGGLAETDAYILSIYSLAIFGVFLVVQFGPRWRKTERSRKPMRTGEATPDECRQKQERDVIVLLIIWALIVVVFARAQVFLQTKHFFTSEFPMNIWHAWSSWFGM